MNLVQHDLTNITLSKTGQFPTTGVSVIMYQTRTRITATLYIEMRALPAFLSCAVSYKVLNALFYLIPLLQSLNS